MFGVKAKRQSTLFSFSLNDEDLFLCTQGGKPVLSVQKETALTARGGPRALSQQYNKLLHFACGCVVEVKGAYSAGRQKWGQGDWGGGQPE